MASISRAVARNLPRFISQMVHRQRGQFTPFKTGAKVLGRGYASSPMRMQQEVQPQSQGVYSKVYPSIASYLIAHPPSPLSKNVTLLEESTPATKKVEEATECVLYKTSPKTTRTYSSPTRFILEFSSLVERLAQVIALIQKPQSTPNRALAQPAPLVDRQVVPHTRENRGASSKTLTVSFSFEDAIYSLDNINFECFDLLTDACDEIIPRSMSKLKPQADRVSALFGTENGLSISPAKPPKEVVMSLVCGKDVFNIEMSRRVFQVLVTSLTQKLEEVGAEMSFDFSPRALSQKSIQPIAPPQKRRSLGAPSISVNPQRGPSVTRPAFTKPQGLSFSSPSPRTAPSRLSQRSIRRMTTSSSQPQAPSQSGPSLPPSSPIPQIIPSATRPELTELPKFGPVPPPEKTSPQEAALLVVNGPSSERPEKAEVELSQGTPAGLEGNTGESSSQLQSPEELSEVLPLPSEGQSTTKTAVAKSSPKRAAPIDLHSRTSIIQNRGFPTFFGKIGQCFSFVGNVVSSIFKGIFKVFSWILEIISI